jgi:phage tail-like protein
MFEYPHVGFHFLVTFELFPPDHIPSLKDISFQSVSGLTATINMENYQEGGENRFVHHLPTGITHPDLVLKRGLFLDAQITGLMPWVRKAVEDFQFEPVNITLSLLNEQHIPLFNWYVVGAIPKKLEISEFNAEAGQVVVETLTLDYQYFTFLKEASIAAGAAGLVGGALSGSVDISAGF